MPPKTNNDRSRRTWKPNVQQKFLWFAPLQKHLRLSVTTSALRTIDKAGGLESYLLASQPAKLDPRAQELRDWLLASRTAKRNVARADALREGTEAAKGAGGRGGAAAAEAAEGGAER